MCDLPYWTFKRANGRVTIASVLQVFMPLVGTPISGLQVFMPLVGIRAPIQDPEKSQWEVMPTSGVQVLMSVMAMRATILDPE